MTENEEIDIMVKECDEEGWLMGRNSQGTRGYIPHNYVEVGTRGYIPLSAKMNFLFQKYF